APIALAQSATGDSPWASGSSFSPQVPVSALARPAAWLDYSRMHITTEFSVGSGLSGTGTNALQVTRLSYQFGAPLAMQVSVGNAFGAGGLSRGNSMFLEGLDVSYHPSSSLLIQLRYQDVRSPLQLSR